MEKGINKVFADEITLTGIENMIKNNPDLMEKFKGFEEFMMMYSCAIKEVQTKFEVLSSDMAVSRNRNPIEMIKSRVKRPQSIMEKLKRKNYPLNMESILTNIRDVAGIRIVCSFVDDIYDIARMLARQDDITVLEVKDYIKNPKPNGYRSYHMIVEVPVFFSNQKRNMPVEVQLRTIAMDFWASLEHTMKYKRDIDNAEEISHQLKECADSIAQTDLKMQSIKNQIHNA